MIFEFEKLNACFSIISSIINIKANNPYDVAQTPNLKP